MRRLIQLLKGRKNKKEWKSSSPYKKTAHLTFGKVYSVLLGDVPFWQSKKPFGEYSPKAFSVKVNFSEMGICRILSTNCCISLFDFEVYLSSACLSHIEDAKSCMVLEIKFKL